MNSICNSVLRSIFHVLVIFSKVIPPCCIFLYVTAKVIDLFIINGMLYNSYDVIETIL